jgi:hypothetical protein
MAPTLSTGNGFRVAFKTKINSIILQKVAVNLKNQRELIYFALDELDTDHETLAADITDNLELIAQLGQLAQEVPANNVTILLQLLLVDDVQDGRGHAARHRITAKSVEVERLAEHIGHLFASDERGHGKAVADSLGHCDNVGHDVVILEAPVVGAGATETGLDLVGHDEATARAYMLSGAFDEVTRELHRAAHTLDGLGKERSYFATLRRIMREDILNLSHVLIASFALARLAVTAAICLYR